jgi:hypothetical protein
VDFASLWEGLSTGVGRFIDHGIEPLRALNFSTYTIFLAVLITGGLVTTWTLRKNWLLRKPSLVARAVFNRAHSNPGTIGLSFDDFVRVCGKDPANREAFPTETAKRIWCVSEMRRLKKKHFVVTITHTEADKPTNKLRQFVVLYRELQLWTPQGASAVASGSIKLDEDCLKELRLRNTYPNDDGDDLPVMGQYNVYIRPTRWFDVRHWLLHPNREVRIAVWVTMITTGLPPILDQLFG